jgi:glucose/arabinose dehydrogenase
MRLPQRLRVTKKIALALLLITAFAGCPSDRQAQKTLQGNSSQLDVPPPMRDAAPPVNAIITRLRGPESVLYDAEQDVYFISNLNGGLQTIDGNGFITRVDAKTLFVTLKWIGSGLDAPKGMGIVGDTLYVSDVTAVRRFDRRTGRALGEVKLPGATLINDITTDGQNVYVSDTGLRVAEGHTFLPTGTDAIWKIAADRAEKIASGRELRHPNGLDWVDGRLWVVTFGPRDIYALHGGKPKKIAELPRGQLDGMVRLEDGSVVVSSWLGEGVYRGTPGSHFDPILTGIDAPADLGYDTKRHRLLVPIPGANQVTIHALR